MRTTMNRSNNIISLGLMVICLGIAVEAGIFDDFKNLIGNNDFFDNIQDSLKKITNKDDWNQMDCSTFDGLDKTKLTELSNEATKLTQRATDCVKNGLTKLETNKQLILNKLRDRQTSLSDKLILQENFPQPENWTLTTISSIGNDGLKQMGANFLGRVRNKEALKQMVKNLDTLEKSESNMQTKKRFMELKNQMINKMAGKVKDWTASDLENFDMALLTPDMARMLPKDLLTGILMDKLTTEAQKRPDCRLGRELVKKLKEQKINDQSSFAERGKFVDDLGSLKSFLMTEDLDADMRQVTSIREIADNNWRICAMKGTLSPISKAHFRETQNAMIMSSDDVALLSPCAIGALVPSIVNSSLSYMSPAALKEMDMCIRGADQNVKRQLMILFYEKGIQSNTNKLYSPSLPAPVIQFARQLNQVSESEAKNIAVMDNIALSNQQMCVLSSKIQTPTDNLPADLIASFPLSKVSNLPVTTLRNIGRSLPATALPNLELSKKVFGSMSSITHSQMLQNKDNLIGMNRMTAMKMENKTSIFDLLRELKDSRISPSLAVELLNRLIMNMTEGDISGAIKRLSAIDIENMPVQVMASFGPELKNLDKNSKQVLLLRLGEMNNAMDIPQNARRVIINEGLMAMNMEGGLEAGQLIVMGDAYMDVPPPLLRKADRSTKQLFVQKLNMDIKNGKARSECLSSSLIDTIAGILKELKGSDTSKWSSLDMAECLLVVLSESDQNRMKREVLDDGFCQPVESADVLAEFDEEKCRAAPGNMYDAMRNREQTRMRRQQKSLSELLEQNEMAKKKLRRKRQASSSMSMLERAAITGVDAISDGDLDAIKSSEMIPWLPILGSTEMQKSKAEILVKKLKTYRNDKLSAITDQDVKALGRAFVGFSMEDIDTLSKNIFGTDKQAIASIGMIDDFSKDTVEKVAARARENINLMSNLQVREVIDLNNILCGFSTSDLKNIKTNVFTETISVFKKLDCETENLKNALPHLMEKGYGGVDSWDSSKVRDLGSLVNTVSPENFKDLKAEAYSGISPKTLNKMPSNLLKSMKLEGLRNIQPESAGLMSPSKLGELPADLQAAVKESSGALYGSAGTATMSVFALVFGLVLHRWI